MAIAFGAGSLTDSSGFVNSLTDSSLNITGSDLVLVVAIACRHNNAITGVTHNSTALTLQSSTTYGSNAGIDIWTLDNPTTGTNNIVASLSGFYLISMYSFYLTGADTVESFAGGVSGYGTSTSTTIRTVTDNAWVVSAINLQGNYALAAAGSETERNDSDHTDASLGQLGVYTLPVVSAGTQSTGASWSTADNYTQATVAIRDASVNTGAANRFYGCSFNGCSQVVLGGSPVIRNCTFAETSDTGSAYMWTPGSDIEDTNFIANTTGAAIEHDTWNGWEEGVSTNVTVDADTTTLKDTNGGFTTTVSVNDVVYNETDNSYGNVVSIDSDTQITHTALTGGTNNYWTNADVYSITTPFVYTDVLFSGNTNDVDSTVANTNAVAITKSGTTNVSSYPTGDHVAIQGSVTLTVTAKDKSGTAIQNVQTAIYKTSDRSQLMNEDTNASGIATETYIGSVPVEVEVRCRKGSTADSPRYKPFSSVQNVTSAGLSIDVTLLEDTNNNATS